MSTTAQPTPPAAPTLDPLALTLSLLRAIHIELRRDDRWEGAGNFRMLQTGAYVEPVASVATDTTLLNANGLRRQAIIFNNSTATLYVKYGIGASSTSFTFLVPAQATLIVTDYPGPLNGCWASVNGNAMVTEL